MSRAWTCRSLVLTVCMLSIVPSQALTLGRTMMFGSFPVQAEDAIVAMTEFVAHMSAKYSREDSIRRCSERVCIIYALEDGCLQGTGCNEYFWDCVSAAMNEFAIFKWDAQEDDLAGPATDDTDQRHDALDLAPTSIETSLIPSVDLLGKLAAREGGKQCLFTTRWCPLRPQCSGRVTPSRSSVSVEECLGRAQEEWELCGALAESPLDMLYIEESLANAETSTFPDVESNLWSNPSRPKLAHHAAGWKSISVYVGESDSVSSQPVRQLVTEQAVRAALESCASQQAAGGAAVELSRALAAVANVFRSADAAGAASEQRSSAGWAYNGDLLQDWWALTLLGGMREGFFLDLAAWDAELSSNTLSLERDYGWQGVCVEPNPQHWWGLAHRQCAVVGALVSDEADGEVLYDLQSHGGGLAGIVSPDTDNRDKAFGSVRRSVDIAAVLELANAPRTIHFMSLDVEGAEWQVLSTFPFQSHQVLVMSVERPDLLSRTILRQQGFVFLRSLGSEPDELWLHWQTPNFRASVARYGQQEPHRDFSVRKSEAFEARGEAAAAALASFMRDALVHGPPYPPPLSHAASPALT